MGNRMERQERKTAATASQRKRNSTGSLLPDVLALIKPRRWDFGGGIWADGDQPRFRPGAAGFHKIFPRRRDSETPSTAVAGDRPGGGHRDCYSRTYVLRADATTIEILLAHDFRTARKSAGAHRPAAGVVLRREQNRRADFADHERRGRRAQSDRHRAGGIRGRNPDGGIRLGVSAAHQREHDGGGVRGAADFWRDVEPRVQNNSPDFSRAAENQRGSHRPVDGIHWRRARGEGLSRGSARGKGFRRRGAAAAR